ncbi:MFS family permease [Xanthobacter flavus]|uniref:MFS family permease n=3 Tax=Hyphomicrobiales TaxID=356 RepID=A0A7W9L2M9_9HYPH|nr:MULTISPECIES: MFS transporter [Hyphomicrobiales]MBB5753695.1 MFS family permease [Prosthecomicrobium pneumaticum]MBN8914758.1 MFS transporter [Hyphomicrobiales bacterium]MDR6336850.1 MFS family permease [Xanthobacter flavus]OYX88001.1 MAG: MFS transporter [Xanthobacter sp. 35-67-6]
MALSLLLAMFTISVGYGFLLPILPLAIERLAGTTDPIVVSRHTGMLTGTYTLALFLFAPLWGRLADRHGRRPVLLAGLVGFSLTLALFAVADGLPLLYLGRFLNGLFAASIVPAAYALVGDYARSREWRARRFALLNIAGAIGFLVGPMLGSFTVVVTAALVPGSGEVAASRSPYFAISGFSLVVALAIWIFVPGSVQRSPGEGGTASGPEAGAALPRLLIISFATAAALGAFEVSLALRGTQILNMSTYQIGLMFSVCSLVMLVAQTVVFSPLVKPEVTRWFLTPALAVLAVSVAAVPFAEATMSTAVVVAAIAASAGILSPIATYWISLNADERQGIELGRQTAAASLGQASGSAAGGLLFGLAFLPNAPFMLAAVVVVGGLVASIGISRLLVHGRCRGLLETTP